MEGRKITTVAMNELDKGLLKRDDQKGEGEAGA
jgi:DNA-directed RNA polymerase subunit K/omega